jgi:Mrp family chromosome partitioning ATPase
VDAAIFVLREDHLSVGKLVDAMEMLNESAPAVLGGVMNGSRIHVSRYGYGYGYGYSYGYKYRYGYGYRKRYGYGSRGEKSKDRDSDKVKKRKGEKSDETEKNL